MVFKALTQLRWFIDMVREPLAHSLYSAERLRALLERERDRCDRRGGAFSLVTFSWPDAMGRKRGLTPLVRVVQRRIRATDDIGWFDADRLGVLLRDADAAVGCQIADAIAGAYPADLPPIITHVYTYPSDEPMGPPRERSLTDVGRRPVEIRLPVPQQQSMAIEPRRIQPMASLFIRPIPAWKRLVDIGGASIGLLLFWPVLLFATIAIKLTSRGPVIYRQRRAGLGGTPFTMYKLRTMDADADARRSDLLAANEADGAAFKITNDPRVTPVGRVLRQTSIDELPQLWNVLTGDMSLVGPRPLPCEDTNICAQWQRQRLNVTPGLTCIWQVSGRCEIPFVDWVRMDVQYIRSRTFLHDIRLLARTVPAVVSRRGAY